MYQQDRHENIIDEAWSESKAIEVIGRIRDHTIHCYDKENLWRKHAVEEEESFAPTSLYCGSIGTLIGLRRIASFFDDDVGLDQKQLLEKSLDIYNAQKEDAKFPSLFLGGSAHLFMKQILDPTSESEEQLFELIKSNIENPTLEALWACPGTMILA